MREMRRKVTFSKSLSGSAGASAQSGARHAPESLGISVSIPTFHDDIPVSVLFKEQEMLIKFMDSCKI